MSEYFQAFLLGNGAILGNVCMLPLYPGLFVLLSQRLGADDADDERSVRWMGAVVLAGVISTMVLLGGLLHALSSTFSDILGWVLPIMFGAVFLLGVAMLLDRNPFVRITTPQAARSGRPTVTAFAYGAALAPMTLPCTGPVIISAFVLGSVGGSGDLADAIIYFIFFGLGFGWPLVLMPLLAAARQRQVASFLTRHHRVITVASGVLLIGVAILGFWTDVIQAKN